ncbi:APC family permease [Streptomyces sp. NBC_01020]|uniref:APC family permease n=1 Tax=unclassified Streptomyces TaxID=2593676 RepID=UPI002E1F4FC4|nr:APC family permease [Streptomyces sp. NBC_01020]WSX46514.1 APC family permease [Streptomyces sp. NBC_00963]WSX65410.1 APC family permease [Streptomyces sp. NBC_00932]
MPQNQPPEARAVPAALSQEYRLRKDLGFWGLTAIGFSNILGSGWLFAALYAAQTAGPAALLSWIAAGALCALVALVMVELGATRPEGGGTVRWPLYASGRLVGTVIGWSVLLSVGGTAAEISAIMQYAAHYLPGLYHGGRLTATGLGVAAALSALLTVLNWFAVRVFARLNNLVSVLKVVIPVVTVIALFLSGTHSGRLTDHGGFAPYGYAACLTALAGGGIVYSVNGFQAPLDFSGEARNPRRTVPAAVLTGIALAVLVYLALQLAFLFTVPDSLLGHGWHGVNFDSPFGQLALVLNLHWLATLLYADAVLSPGGSAYVGVAIDARHTYALAKNGLLPRFFMRIDPRSGTAHRALLLNLAVIIVFMLPFGGWQDIVSVMGDMYLLIYAASAVAAAVFRAHDRERGVPRADGRVPGVRWIAPVSFMVSGEFVFWSGWHDLRLALPLVLAGVPLFLMLRRGTEGPSPRDELRSGAWLVFYLAALTLLSWLGSFGGSGRLPAPYDSAVVAAVSLAVFGWAVRSGAGHLRAHPDADPGSAPGLPDPIRP